MQVQGVASSILLSRHTHETYAIDLKVHESCMHVAVRVLHSCAFIATADVPGIGGVPLFKWNSPFNLDYYQQI